LHQNPELSFEEETSRLVYEALESFGCLKTLHPKPPGMVARLAGGEPGRMVTLRTTDMEALPITEENDFEFISNSNGVLHARRHEGHTAMYPGTAKVLSGMKEDIQGEVCFLFWHTEELYPSTVVSEAGERA
jgi:metal-dependent amidase/aminoacylase/carboxypeptidase family protein